MIREMKEILKRFDIPRNILYLSRSVNKPGNYRFAVGDEASVEKYVDGEWKNIGGWADGVVDSGKYEDLRFPAVSQRMLSPAGRVVLDDECGMLFKSTAIYPDDSLLITGQFPHSKIKDGMCYPHIHWIQDTDNSPNWLLEWRWYNNGEVVGAFAPVASVSSQLDFISGACQVEVFPSLTKAGEEESVSSIIDIRLYRDTTNVSGLFAGADSYTGDVLLKEFDIHYKNGSFGSVYPWM